ncbi:MAG: hypothetical protein ACI8QZ_000816 [Chlamydiales bacterium]
MERRGEIQRASRTPDNVLTRGSGKLFRVISHRTLRAQPRRPRAGRIKAAPVLMSRSLWGMRRARSFLWILAGLAGCRAAGVTTPSTFAVAGLGLQVASAIEGGFLELRFEGQVVDRWGLWIEDGIGARVEPRMVTDGAAAKINLGLAHGGPVAAARFSLSELTARPWVLHVLPRAEPAWNVLLARVEQESIDRPCDMFGYRRERWVYPDGEQNLVYARTTPEGLRVEVPRSVFDSGLHRSLSRVSASIPETVRQAIVVCPEVADTIARGFEGGARYKGPAEGENRHPHARGERFWSRPRLFRAGTSRAGHEDPIDSLVWFLVEMFNASAADAYRGIWDRVLDGSLSEDEYLAQETLQKAIHLRRAVETLRANADCLGLSADREGGALVFSEYEQWVITSRGDPRTLARIIRNNPARYTSNPAEADLTYAQRLRGLYREHAPISGARSGW